MARNSRFTAATAVGLLVMLSPGFASLLSAPAAAQVIFADGSPMNAPAGSTYIATGSGSGIAFHASGSGGLLVSGGNLTISSGIQNTGAVVAESGGKITLLVSDRVTTSADIAAGLVADGAGSTVTGGATVATSGFNADAVYARNGGSISLTGGSYTTTGRDSSGLMADSGGTITATGVAIGVSYQATPAVSAATAGRITLDAASRISTSGDNSAGIGVTGAGSTITSAATVQTSGQGAFGIFVQLGGQVMLQTGAAITTTQNRSAAIYSTDTGSKVTGTATVETSGRFALGANASSGGQITLDSASTIVTHGDLASGLYSDGSGGATGTTIVTSSARVTTNGQSANGAEAEGGGMVTLTAASNITTNGSVAAGLFSFGYLDGGGVSAITNAGSVTTAQAGSYGAVAQSGGTITLLSGTSITTSGATSYGVHAIGVSDRGDVSAVSGVANISTSGANAYGAYAINGGKITLDAGSVVATTGATASGLYALNADAGTGTASSIASAARVTTATQKSYGAYASGGGHIALNAGSDISTAGIGAHGLYANGSDSVITGTSTVTTSGDSADAVRVANGGSLTLTDSTLNATGAGSNGLSMAAAAGAASTANLTNTAIVSPNGASIAADSGSADISLTNVTAQVNNGTWLSVGNAASTVPAAAIVVADNSRLTGAALTLAGHTADVTLQNGTIWNVTGDSNVTNLANNASTIAFAVPSGDPAQASGYRMLTTGSYRGNGGTLSLNTHLGGDGSPSDRLVIDGGTATGSTSIVINNMGGSGARTQADGIMVVQGINGAVTGSGQGDSTTFRLASRVAAGAYEYGLYYGGNAATGGNSGDQNWYLRTVTLPSDNSGPQSRPALEPRSEIPTNAAVMPVALQFGYAMLGSVADRNGGLDGMSGAGMAVTGAVSEERSVWCRDRTVKNPDDREKCVTRVPVAGSEAEIRWARSGWAQVIGGRGSSDQDNYFRNGSDYNYTFGGIKAGLDIFAHQQTDGTLDKAGLYAGYGQISSDVFGPEGARYGHKAGTVDMDAYSVGAYWTHFAAQGWYADATVQGTWYTNTHAKSVLNETISPDGFGVIGSLEGGYQFRLGSGWTLTPQAQIAYGHVTFDNARDSFGVFRFQDGDSLRGRLGARLSKTWNMAEAAQPRLVTTWLRANVWHEFLGNTKTSVVGFNGENPLTTPSSLEGTWGEVGAGLGAQISSNVSLYAVGNYQHSLDGKGMQGWDGKLGLNVKW